MLPDKKKKIQATGVLTLNILSIDGNILEWLEATDFNLSALAKGVGIDHEHKAKATITIELVEEPCAICGKPTLGDKICQNCGKIICDQCAETTEDERYCPVCKVIKQPAQPMQP